MTQRVSIWFDRLTAIFSLPDGIKSGLASTDIGSDVDNRDYELSFWRAAFSISY